MSQSVFYSYSLAVSQSVFYSYSLAVSQSVSQSVGFLFVQSGSQSVSFLFIQSSRQAVSFSFIQSGSQSVSFLFIQSGSHSVSFLFIQSGSQSVSLNKIIYHFKSSTQLIILNYLVLIIPNCSPFFTPGSFCSSQSSRGIPHKTRRGVYGAFTRVNSILSRAYGR